MMRLLVIFLIIMLTACGGGSVIAPVGKYTKQKAQKPPAVYTVKKGDTLYSISFRYGLDYKTLAKINGICFFYTIYLGQKLHFKLSKQAKRTDSKKSTTKKTATKQTSKTTKQNKPVNNSRLSWRWPTKGKVISTFSSSATGRKGIDIAGKSGQNVVAAAAGKVVYSGNGLPRYGNLLIIKHNDVYLSAYAHNKALYVKEGQWVKGGQKIATLGNTGTQTNQLHFEIRRNGKPVDPMRFLPKK
jgi:lipoprotein NlpD